MMSRVAATVDSGGKSDPGKSRDTGNLAGAQNRQEECLVSVTEKENAF